MRVNQEDGKSAPPTYKFSDDDKVVGFAAVAFRNCPHPVDSASEVAKYLVSEDLHGVENPNVKGESYAVTLFRTLERFAREKEGVVALSLWVRSDNVRAIAFYEKVGFKRDPGGPVQRNGGSPHLTMRKIL